ncbi:MAG: hypothetical protein ACK5LC_13390 [Coprobacillaceae bacterium]
MNEKEKLYAMMLLNMIEKLDGYMECLNTIQLNYDLEMNHKEILLNGQLQMVHHLIESDKRQIYNTLKEKL